MRAGPRTAAVAVLLLLAPGGCTMVSPPPAPEPAPPAGGPPARPGHPDRPAPPPADPGAVPRRFEEVRALWVVRTTLASPERIGAMVERADQAGFNTLLVQVRGRGDAYYRSAWEPRAEALSGQPGSFDPLDMVLREAHARGMAVHAWVNTHLVGGVAGRPADPAHVINEAPDLLAVPRELAGSSATKSPFDPGFVPALLEHARRNPSTVEGLYTSPSHPEVHERVVRIWTDILERYPVDGMHFDYVRYPGPSYDYSEGALRAFRAWVGPRLPPARVAELDGAARGDALAWTRGEPSLWAEFRREQITSLVRRVRREAKRVRPDVTISAAVFADAADARASRFQDWPAWMDEGLLDVVVPMAYTPDGRRFRGQVADAVRVAGDPRRVWAGIGVYQTTFEGTVSKIGITREEGATGVVLFSYDWAASEGESAGGVSFLDRVGRRAFGR